MDLREQFLKAYHAKSDQRISPAMPPDQPLADLKEALSIAVINQKGGCGKTTTTLSVASCLAEMGYTALVVDLDPQAHATLGLGIQGDALDLTVYHLLVREELSVSKVLAPTYHRNLKLLPSNGLLAAAQVELLQVPEREFLLKKKLEEIKGLFHFILMDCPPSLNVLTINALTAAFRLIVPVQTQYYSLDGMRELFKSVELIRENSNRELEILGILPTLFDSRTKLNQAMLQALREYFGTRLFDAVIHLNAVVAECPMVGQPVIRHAPGCRGAKDYRQLTEEIITRVSQTSRSFSSIKEAV